MDAAHTTSAKPGIDLRCLAVPIVLYVVAAVLVGCLCSGCVSAGYRSQQTETHSPDGTVTTQKTRTANYIDSRQGAEAFGAMIDQVDWGSLLKGPIGIAIGASGLGGLGLVGWIKNLHAHKHQSLGRAQVRNAKPEAVT